MKKLCVIALVLAVAVFAAGCGNSADSDADIVAVYAGDSEVMLDEAKYYLYTAQATYEAYCISLGYEMEWSDIMSGDTTWTEGVKSLTFDDICRRECIYLLAVENEIRLTVGEEKEADEMAEEYLADSKDTLISQVGITDRERLKEIFEKKIMAEKQEELLEEESAGSTDLLYEAWKEEYTLSGTTSWEELDFSVSIFDIEDGISE